ncbi:MAG: hypothetical protein EOO89_25450 [Pedobacter sp.]|nr:MAG: hypothetical protein EOO89_25450 [Pedobacter sp.]
MLKNIPYSASVLAFAGLLLSTMGIYFVLLRPPLLQEDLRYMKTTVSTIHKNIPTLSDWLQKVFWVMGGYIFTTGLLTAYVAVTSFRTRMRGAFIIATMAGFTSIGFMTTVNFIIESDFKWLLLIFTISWMAALALYLLRK